MASTSIVLGLLFTVVSSAGGSSGGGGASDLQQPQQQRWLEEPADLVAVKNRPALLPCHSGAAEGGVTYSWTLDDRPLPNNNTRLQLLNNGSLYLKKVKAESRGVYRCVLRTQHGSIVSRPARLQLPVLGAVTVRSVVPASGAAATLGDPVLLSCSFESVPPVPSPTAAVTVSWLRDDRPLDLTHRHIILNDGTLIISKIQYDDEGQYKCLVHNRLLNKTREGVTVVRVVEREGGPAPLEIVHPAAAAVSVVNWTVGRNGGGGGGLVCLARGSPTPLVKWTVRQRATTDNDPQEGAGIEEAGSVVSVLVTNATEAVSVFRVDSVRETDAAEYVCVASQQVHAGNTVSVTKEVVVDVLRPLVITKRPVSLEFPTAKTARFRCKAEGNPLPTYTWYKDGVRLHINGRIKQKQTLEDLNELVVSNSLSSDSGVYQCEATNGVGWGARASARLLVKAPPVPPPDRLACVSSARGNTPAVNLTWRQPGTPVKAFTVHYLPTNGGEETMSVTQMQRDGRGGEQAYSVDKLRPYTNYTFYVRAYDMAASDKSAEVVCQTAGTVPIGVPKVEVQAQSPRSLLLRWKPLETAVARGAITQHKVQWKKKGQPANAAEIVPGDVMSFTITDGLEPATEYETRVLSATADGWPELLEAEMPWTVVATPSLPLPPSDPLLPPPTLRLAVINATTIQVHWSVPPSASAQTLSGFQLRFRKSSSDPSSPVTLPPDATEHLLLNLEPETWYEVGVRAVGGVGGIPGEEGVRGTRTTADDAISRPAPALTPDGLGARPRSPTAIELNWRPVPGATRYTVTSAPVSQPDNTTVLECKDSSVRVTGLRPYTMYGLRVRAHAPPDLIGQFSRTLECRTLEDVPDRVVEVQWTPLNSTSVKLTWRRLPDKMGPVSGYVVRAAGRPDTPADQWRATTVPSPRPTATLSGLEPNTRYWVRVSGVTAAGEGPASQATELVIPVATHHRLPPAVSTPPAPPTVPQRPPPDHSRDQLLGVVLGCAIGGGCVALCLASLVWRRRCAKRHSAGVLPPPPLGSHGSNSHEMQCLPTYRHDTEHIAVAKGLYSGDCSRVNGVHLPLLSNGRVPNASVSDHHPYPHALGVRITENPQFESCEELRQPSDEGDSLLSGHSLNDTTQTMVLLATSPNNKHGHEPDDGFHESHPALLPEG